MATLLGQDRTQVAFRGIQMFNLHHTDFEVVIGSARQYERFVQVANI